VADVRITHAEHVATLLMAKRIAALEERVARLERRVVSMHNLLAVGVVLVIELTRGGLGCVVTSARRWVDNVRTETRTARLAERRRRRVH